MCTWEKTTLEVFMWREIRVKNEPSIITRFIEVTKFSLQQFFNTKTVVYI